MHLRPTVTPQELAAANRLVEALVGLLGAVQEGTARREADRAKYEALQREGDGIARGLWPRRSKSVNEPEGLLTTRQATAYLGISGRTLWTLTSPRGPIPVARFGTALRYSLNDLKAAVERLKAAKPH